jgi:hypothetical protein
MLWCRRQQGVMALKRDLAKFMAWLDSYQASLKDDPETLPHLDHVSCELFNRTIGHTHALDADIVIARVNRYRARFGLPRTGPIPHVILSPPELKAAPKRARMRPS